RPGRVRARRRAPRERPDSRGGRAARDRSAAVGDPGAPHLSGSDLRGSDLHRQLRKRHHQHYAQAVRRRRGTPCDADPDQRQGHPDDPPNLSRLRAGRRARAFRFERAARNRGRGRESRPPDRRGQGGYRDRRHPARRAAASPARDRLRLLRPMRGSARTRMKKLFRRMHGPCASPSSRAIGDMILGALCGSIALGASNALADSDLGYRIYWGDFHAHSTLSDGFRAPAEAFRWARDVAGLDILALSDHTHLLSASEWELLGKAAREFTEEGRFLALRSQEFGTPVHFGRINIHGCPIRNPNATTTLPATYAFLVEQEAVGVFNPPSTSVGTLFDDLAFHPEFEQAMVGMEVVNARGLCQELWIEALDNGWKLAPFGSGGPGADGSAGAERSKEGKTCVTGVLAEELTEEAVLEALRARRFFASEQRPAGDLLAVRFESGGHPMGSQIAHSGSSIEFEASGI